MVTNRQMYSLTNMCCLLYEIVFVIQNKNMFLHIVSVQISVETFLSGSVDN